MSKLTTDSKWAGLTEEQRDTVEGWLFEENTTYREALERAEKEFGITASVSSIARLYQKMSDERLEAELAEHHDKISDKLGGSPDFHVEDLSYAAMMADGQPACPDRQTQTEQREGNRVAGFSETL